MPARVSQPTGCVRRLPDSRPTTSGRSGSGRCERRLRHARQPSAHAHRRQQLRAGDAVQVGQVVAQRAPRQQGVGRQGDRLAGQRHRPPAAGRRRRSHWPGCTGPRAAAPGVPAPPAGSPWPRHAGATASARRRGRCAPWVVGVQQADPAQRRLGLGDLVERASTPASRRSGTSSSGASCTAASSASIASARRPAVPAACRGRLQDGVERMLHAGGGQAAKFSLACRRRAAFRRRSAHIPRCRPQRLGGANAASAAPARRSGAAPGPGCSRLRRCPARPRSSAAAVTRFLRLAAHQQKPAQGDQRL